MGHLDVGATIVDDLHKNTQMGWTFSNRDEAMRAVESGQAYAAFVIPAGFSADIAAIAQGDLTKAQIEARLLASLHAERILWLDYGYLAGDDTDSHIDTLARFCPNNTIAYVRCTDTND